jgi:hypothetical protein
MVKSSVALDVRLAFAFSAAPLSIKPMAALKVVFLFMIALPENFLFFNYQQSFIY